MLGQQALSLSIFKVIDFFQLKPKEILFYRAVFTSLFCDNSKELILQLFERLAANTNFYHLRDQLQNFFANAFRKSSLKNREIYSDSDAKKIRELIKDIKTIFSHASAFE